MANEVAEHLRQALALFGENGERWAKGKGLTDPERPNLCALSALAAVKGSYVVECFARDALCRFVSAALVSEWNDAPERTWPEVRAAFQEAIRVSDTLPTPEG